MNKATALKLLMIEDSEDDALLIQHELRKGGFNLEPLVVKTLEELNSALEKESWDLILSDYTLKNFSGHNALKTVKEKGRDIPFIVISGVVGEEMAVSMMRAGAQDYLIKDNIKRLVPAVERELLEKKQRIEREQTLDRLRNSEKTLNAIFENTGTAILVIEEDTSISLANLKGSEVSGYSMEEIIGSSWTRFIYPEDLERMKEFHKLRREQRDTAPNNYEFRFLTKNEVKIPVYMTIDLIPGTKQSVVSLIDISLLKQMEERFRLICSSMQDAIVMIDENGIICYWNSAAEKIFGYSKAEALGSNLHKLVVPERYLEAFLTNFSNFQKTGTGTAIGKTVELTALKKNGSEFPVELSLAAVEINRTYHSIGIIRDITKRKKTESEKKFLEQEIRKSQKMEAIATLAGGIAHDFNNILSAIMGFNELALAKEENPDIKKCLTQVHRASARAKDLVAQILTFSRGEEQENRPVTLKPILKEVLKLLRASVPSEIDIQHELNCESVIMTDPVKIHQVVMNLCTNAYQAMEETGGTLRVSLKDIQIDKNNIMSVPEMSPGKYVHLQVIDSGHGIPSDIIDKIFDPFFTTKVKGKGSGLGLSVVQGIVNASNGRVTVESKIGKGSKFNVYLPVVDLNGDMEKPEEISITSGNGRILYVDDEEMILNVGASILERIGYQVTSYNSSVTALKKFLISPQKYDLALLDIAMPEMDGIKLAKKMLRVRPDMKIVLHTGYQEKLTREDAEKLGIKAIIQKPWTTASIAKLLAQILQTPK